MYILSDSLVWNNLYLNIFSQWYLLYIVYRVGNYHFAFVEKWVCHTNNWLFQTKYRSSETKFASWFFIAKSEMQNTNGSRKILQMLNRKPR